MNSRQLLAAASSILRTPASFSPHSLPACRTRLHARSYAVAAAKPNAAGNLLNSAKGPASNKPLSRTNTAGAKDAAASTGPVANARPSFIPGKFYFASQFVRNKAQPMRTMHTKYRRLGPGSRESHANDPFIQLGIDPLREFQNIQLLNHFMTRMGKISPRHETGLSWRSQRKMGKAIRRAKAMCLIPQQSRTVPRARVSHN